VTVALILTGPPGAGKSSVLEALTTLLELDGVEYSALESEQLAWGSPWLSPEQRLPQLTAVMTLQRDVGRRLFLLAATTETTDELRRVANAVGADRTLAVLLVANPDVVAARLDAREPDRWPGKANLIAHPRQLAVSMPRELEGVDASIETDGRTAVDVAVKVRDALAPVLRAEAGSRSDEGRRLAGSAIGLRDGVWRRVADGVLAKSSSPATAERRTPSIVVRVSRDSRVARTAGLRARQGLAGRAGRR
jgi:energy-coupling factor transporter ATP-binding protein EcfA2